MRQLKQPEHDILQLNQQEITIWEEYRNTELRTRRERLFEAAKWTAGIAFIFGAVVGLEATGVISAYIS